MIDLPAFIIGNGPSRKCIDLESLRDKGTIFGCNALYRDFIPDYLVTLADDITEEVIDSGYPVHRHLFPPAHERIEVTGTSHPTHSGNLAAILAAQKGYKTLYLLGIDSLFNSAANIYYGSPCYQKIPKLDDDTIKRRTDYFTFTAKQRFKYVNFVFVMPKNEKPKHPLQASNIKGMYYDDFAKTFGIELHDKNKS